MLVWNGPALLLTILAAIPAIIGCGLLGMEFGPGWMLVTGLGMAVLDAGFRSSTELGMFSLEASTFFFILPTWVAGALLALGGLVGLFG